MKETLLIIYQEKFYIEQQFVQSHSLILRDSDSLEMLLQMMQRLENTLFSGISKIRLTILVCASNAISGHFF